MRGAEWKTLKWNARAHAAGAARAGALPRTLARMRRGGARRGALLTSEGHATFGRRPGSMLLGASQSAAFGARLQLRAAARPAPAAGALVVEAAHKKGGGSSKNKDDSHAQRLGVKLYGDQPCTAGNIIIRQRGTVVRAARTPEAWP